jgi:hypothetical protein
LVNNNIAFVWQIDITCCVVTKKGFTEIQPGIQPGNELRQNPYAQGIQRLSEYPVLYKETEALTHQY